MFFIKRSYSSFFQLSGRSKTFQKVCKAFADRELKPIARFNDKLARFPQNHIEHLGQEGFLGVCIDAKYGGSGHDLLTFALGVEELSRRCASTGILVSIHNCLYADLVQTYGTPEQIKEFLIPFTNGQIGVFALSEHDAGSDAANISSTAKKIGENYLLNGRKAWITSGMEGKAGVFFISTDKSKGHKGITAFLVPLDADGVEVGEPVEKMGIRATSTCDIILKNVEVPSKNIIGNIGQGFEIAMRQLQLGRIGVGAQALGVGQAALDLAVKYSCKRIVFDDRLCEKQLVKGKLAKMATNLEAARLLLHKAAALRDQNEDFRKLSSMAKYAASRCATSNAHDCVQILGAKGFVSGEAERLYRDSRITQIYGGATDIQKLVIADLILKEADK